MAGDYLVDGEGRGPVADAVAADLAEEKRARDLILQMVRSCCAVNLPFTTPNAISKAYQRERGVWEPPHWRTREPAEAHAALRVGDTACGNNLEMALAGATRKLPLTSWLHPIPFAALN